MASPEKKIRQAGWSKRPYKEARHEIKRFVATDGVAKAPATKSWKCKKNRGDHTLVHVEPNGPSAFGQERVQYLANLFAPDTRKSFLSEGAKVYFCSACNKVIYKWNKR